MKKVKVLELRPTQFAVGMHEVAAKVRKLTKMTHEERHDYLIAHPIPVVSSPEGAHYMIDHHHLARAAWEAGIEDVFIKVQDDLSGHTEQKFWEKMKSEGWLYLKDQFGHGPHEEEMLPIDLRGLADDPFRSLAWAVRDANGFTKGAVPFCEFRWSEFFRKRMTGNPMRIGFDKALQEALKLCHDPDAKLLPGYIEPSNKKNP
jgi:hypothetical protein